MAPAFRFAVLANIRVKIIRKGKNDQDQGSQKFGQPLDVM